MPDNCGKYKDAHLMSNTYYFLGQQLLCEPPHCYVLLSLCVLLITQLTDAYIQVYFASTQYNLQDTIGL
jgi:hypothetical protein